MRRLAASEGRQAAGKERQAALVKLRLEKRRLQNEGRFEEAALIMGQATSMGDRLVNVDNIGVLCSFLGH